MEQDPPAGHRERFGRRLGGARGKSRSFYLPYLKMAGVVTLFIFSGLWLLEHSGILPRQRHEPPEYVEAEMYYISQVNARLSSLRKMHFIGDSLQKEMLLKELSGMDSLYLELQQELKMNPGDERLLEAMTEYYEVKLDILNNIIRQLSALQQTKPKEHESESL